MGAITFSSNAATVAHTLADLVAGLPAFGQQVSRDSADRIVAKAKEFAHVGKDPTSPPGRPHMRDTIGAVGVNQYTSRVQALGPAIYEEARGGDHAFMSRAVAAVQSDLTFHAEQLLRQRMLR